jgi:NAD(P)-dependent dehydrogenase (short-subunit alcohol dehydrogenase family)
MKYIIVGGTSGIGLATAKKAIEAGDEVTVAGRDPARFPAAHAVGATTARLDAGDPPECQRFFADRGGFHHLVLCTSGASGAGAFRELSLDDLRNGFDGKFWSQLTCAKAALASLDPAGSITFVSAISSRAMKPGTSGLAAINAALEAMVPILASELAPLRVNAVAPGVIDTPWWSRVPDDARQALFEQLGKQVAVGRVGTEDEVASAILLMTTNAFITGTVLDCDGGWKLRDAG